MKYRLLKLSAIFMTSIVATLGGVRMNVHAASVHAGVSAALADCIKESSQAVLKQKGSGTGTDSNTDQKEESDTKKSKTDNKKEADNKKKTNQTSNKKKAVDIKSSTNETKKKKSAKICGYTNLGMANVDNYLNIRQEASEDGEVIGKLPSYAGCEILDKDNGWYRIKSGNVSGFVKSDYIITGEKAEKLANKLKKKMATVNSMTVNIRQKPNTKCTILTLATEGDELEVVKEGKEWIEVKLDDENGYISTEFADISEELKKATVYHEEAQTENSTGDDSGSSSTTYDVKSSLVQTALSYVGYPYVWGGTSLTGGVDCSGFTMQIMAKYGVYLPHLASAQAGYGRSVSTSELQPGDLIFYGSSSDISHVAIYIGNGQIVHASNSVDGIKVSSAFYRTPVCCRRMF